MPEPLISVIVVCRNPGPSVQRALSSIWEQKGAEVETVVIDGASTDGTREWLETERHRLGHLISGPDGGVYDAMNKGVAAARGEWVLFLGADDRLADGVIEALRNTLRSTNAAVVVGEVAYDDGRVYGMEPLSKAVRRNFVHHQGAFYRRHLFERHGGFDARLRIMADYGFNLRLAKAGVAFEGVPTRICNCGVGGMSDSGAWAGYREEITVRRMHFPLAQRMPWNALSIVRFLRKKVVVAFR